jgi:hypothetical protein
MSAIEIMDPKMDAGMLRNTGKNVPYTFETAVEVSSTAVMSSELMVYHGSSFILGTYIFVFMAFKLFSPFFL